MRYFGILVFLLSCNALSAAVAKPLLITALQNPPGCRYGYVITKKPADTAAVVKKNSLSAGINYGSDALFFGRTGPTKYPFMAADLVINYQSGFFVYGSALKVLGYNLL
jgi:hypothetical protein